jgi:hypothetical protein
MKIRWSSLFFGVFCTSLPNQVEHTCLKFLLTGVLTPNFNTMDLIKILEKNQKLHIQIVVVTLKVTSCRTMSKRKKVKKSEKPRFYGQNKLFLENPAL